MACSLDFIEFVSSQIATAMMLSAERGFPYEGAKEHYILDVSRSDFAVKVVKVLAEVLPFPKSRKKNK